MDKNIKLLQAYLHRFLTTMQIEPIHASQFDPAFLPLVNQIEKLCHDAAEAMLFSSLIAEGCFDVKASNENIFLGPLKDFQSTLRHLTWQTKQVAEGNYNQKIAYLGDLSTSFNKMIDQLKNREDVINENARIQEEKANTISKLFETELNHQLAYYENIDKLNHQVQDFRHDMKNHIFCIRALLTEQHYEEAIAYLDDISLYIKSDFNLLNTGNPIFDALISEKVRYAKQQDITVSLDINIHQKINMKSVDWAIIFGNMLDNALEACRLIPQVEKRKIAIKVAFKKDHLIAEIENTFCHKPIQKNGDFITNKEDSAFHGRGLHNIREAIKKYNGFLNIEFDDATFRVLLMLDVLPTSKGAAL